MKKINLYIVGLAVALSAVGIIALSPKPAVAQSCCGGATEPSAVVSES